MTAKDLKKYLPLINALDGVIAAAQSAKLNDTAALLSLARRDLTLRASGVSAADVGQMMHEALHRPAPVKGRRKRPVRKPH